MTEGNDPAMPNALGGKDMNGEDDWVTNGLTKRELFASRQMAACRMASPELDETVVAEQAVKDADALIKALNK